ncbi:DUF6252 family protein [Autumnicola musiva]|uniref:DUF6252 family protein n=1 Tax=Autumnicola musiva TaxID=3075589 RepID=A0ABU3DAG4_9FLAO|nr:DUF6252 family protein [Zunongwangia sp. F117]MDT0678524.1 DUF6252 family protein [Zunongwangia sp. F117]
MKILYLILIVSLGISTSCNNDDDQPRKPIDQLPAATQSGEQTFGCLINGEVFIPDNFGRGRPNAFYQFVNGAYTLGIHASNKSGEELLSVGLGALHVEPVQETQYILNSEASGNFYGIYLLGGGLTLDTTTTNNSPGTINITNFDPENFIISGTFEFTVFDNEGNEIKITDGRFDMLYTN